MSKGSTTVRPLPFSAISAQTGFLLGKVLTIVDAAYNNPIQNKSVKDLIRQAFNHQQDYMAELCGEQNSEYGPVEPLK